MRPYADALLHGVAPPPSRTEEDSYHDDDDDNNDHDDETWRWERERKSQDEHVYDAVRSLVEGSGGSGSDIDGCVFLKQMVKFSNLFDFDINWEGGALL